MVDAYDKLEEIGKGNQMEWPPLGSFGSVYKIRRKSDNSEFVWKELDYGRMSDREKQQVVSEINILS
jgi:hypothetical protein